MQKQQNSLIAGLRATNELMMRHAAQEDKTPTATADKAAISTISGTVAATCPPTSDAFSPTFSSTENEEKDASSSVAAVANTTTVTSTAEPHAVQRVLATKRAYALNRSDSTGSSAGRKFLAPTSSDPQQRSTLTDKERLHISSQQKKKNSMTTPGSAPMATFAAASAAGGLKRDKTGFFNQFNNEIGQFHYPSTNMSHFGADHHGHGGLGSPSGMVTHLMPGSKLLTFNNQANAVYEVHDWWQESVLCPQASDDEM